MEKHKYIHRKEEPGANFCWVVQLECTPTKHLKIFSDSRYGGKESALEKAIQYRDKIIRKEGLILVENRRVHNNRKSTNTTGVNGVSKSSGFYHAYIHESPYKRKAAKFSISKYGEDLAYKRAVMWRKGMELVVYGQSRIADL
ncbi:hypothetical protein KKI24_11650 [bacterium]|nr:hypothetical protein [bacterium]